LLLALKTTKWFFLGRGTGALKCATSLTYFTLVIGVALPDNSPPGTLQEIESFKVVWHNLDQQLSSLFAVTTVILAGVRGLLLGGKSGIALKSDVAVLFP